MSKLDSDFSSYKDGSIRDLYRKYAENIKVKYEKKPTCNNAVTNFRK